MFNPFEYFEYYRVYERIAQILRAELEEDIDAQRRCQVLTEIGILEESMRSIAHTIEHYTPVYPPPKYSALKQSDDRAFLHCRYILGLTMEQTAEKMHVSRDTAYRIRRRIAQTSIPYGSKPRA